MANRIAEAVRDDLTSTASPARGNAGHAIRQRPQRAVDSVRRRDEGAEWTIRSRPGGSVALCFGASVVAGVLLTLEFRGKRGWV